MTVSGFGSFLGAVLAVVWSASAAAQVSVKDAWVRAVPGQKVAGAYLTVTSAAGGRLVGVETPAAKVAEIHEMRHENGVMRMRRREALDLPAGEPVKLAPGGLHIMFMSIEQPLVAGQEVALTLVVEEGGKRQTVEVRAPVRAAGAGGGHEHH